MPEIKENQEYDSNTVQNLVEMIFLFIDYSELTKLIQAVLETNEVKNLVEYIKKMLLKAFKKTVRKKVNDSKE